MTCSKLDRIRLKMIIGRRTTLGRVSDAMEVAVKTEEHCVPHIATCGAYHLGEIFDGITQVDDT